jgi:hypothetical protein
MTIPGHDDRLLVGGPSYARPEGAVRLLGARKSVPAAFDSNNITLMAVDSIKRLVSPVDEAESTCAKLGYSLLSHQSFI